MRAPIDYLIKSLRQPSRGRERFAAGQEIEPSVPHKGGHNAALERWKQFGGTLERPAPPAPIHKAK